MPNNLLSYEYEYEYEYEYDTSTSYCLRQNVWPNVLGLVGLMRLRVDALPSASAVSRIFTLIRVRVRKRERVRVNDRTKSLANTITVTI